MGIEREIKNARIERLSIQIEDHGILTAWVFLEYGCGGQGFGGFCFGTRKEPKGEYLGVFVNEVMRVADSDTWEGCKGKYVRADANFGHVHGIGPIFPKVTENLDREEWFYPKEAFDKIRGEE